MPPRLARIGREEMRQTKRGTGYSLSDQHIYSLWKCLPLNSGTTYLKYEKSAGYFFFQINIFCQQLTQNTTTDFVSFTQNVLKFKTCKTCVYNFRTNDFVNLTKSVIVFWVNCWQNMLISQRLTCTDVIVTLTMLEEIVMCIVHSEIQIIVW